MSIPMPFSPRAPPCGPWSEIISPDHCSIITGACPRRRPYTPDAAGAGRRALRNVCLDLLVATGRPDAVSLAAQQYQAADNMTDRMAALSTLSLRDVPERTAALDDFYTRYGDNPLIVDKWFTLQATIPEPATLGSGQGADRTCRVLVRQSQSRARA